MAEAARIDGSDGRCVLAGALDFASVAQVWQGLASGGWLKSAQSADLSAVTAADSAGLALLVAWRAARERAGGTLRFQGVPERLQALARLTEAQSLLDV
ncbi:MAG: STAS domain-containing protein [Steroidobacteraceae bacterium]